LFSISVAKICGSPGDTASNCSLRVVAVTQFYCAKKNKTCSDMTELRIQLRHHVGRIMDVTKYLKIVSLNTEIWKC